MHFTKLKDGLPPFGSCSENILVLLLKDSYTKYEFGFYDKGGVFYDSRYRYKIENVESWTLLNNSPDTKQGDVMPLVPIKIKSVYKAIPGPRIDLPKRMSLCTPDTCSAILNIKKDVESIGGHLYLSDLFRSYDMQFQAYSDFASGKKSSYSPPPGGSMHEAGRAFDIDLESINIPLKKFWEIAKEYGVVPIVDAPDTRLSEAWHFDCRGSHSLVYEYYGKWKGIGMVPYKAMAASAILCLGYKHDSYGGKELEAAIQFSLIRLGCDIGDVDGIIGRKTKKALSSIDVKYDNSTAFIASDLHAILKDKYPQEYV